LSGALSEKSERRAIRVRGDDRSGVIEVVFRKNYGSLALTCDDEAFARIRDRILSEVVTDNVRTARVEALRSVHVGRIPDPRDLTPGPFRRVRDVICLILCACFSIPIHVVGIVVIVRWILERIS
jgi:hypothetical protein